MRAFHQDVEAEKKGTCCHNFVEKLKHDVIFVDQMHIPIILIFVWLCLGTTAYVLVQQWNVAKSFYFMVQVRQLAA